MGPRDEGASALAARHIFIDDWTERRLPKRRRETVGRGKAIERQARIDGPHGLGRILGAGDWHDRLAGEGDAALAQAVNDGAGEAVPACRPAGGEVTETICLGKRSAEIGTMLFDQ